MKNSFFLIVFSLFILGGCKKTPLPPEVLSGTKWKLVRYTAGFGQTYPIGGSQITLRFETDSLFGRAGCNDYFGSWEYRVPDSLIVSGPVSMTESYCEGYMQQEQLFLNLLATTAHFIVNDTFLQLSGSQGVLFFANEASPGREQEAVLTGCFIAGNEVSTFRDCADTTAVFWLEDETNTLAELYAILTAGEEYRPVLLEVKAAKLPRLNLGYASEYDGLIRVREVRHIALPAPEDPCFKVPMATGENR